jgi:antitoxin component YwqK of YwqJK toxin-antitoxin module
MLLRTLLILPFVLASLLLSSQNTDSLEFKTYFYEGGAKSSEGYLKNGKPEGYWRSYYRNGKLKTEGNRKSYALDSVWSFYAQSGEKTVEITYQKGVKQGLTRTFKNQKVIREDNFVDDKIEGFSKEFFPSGELKNELPYKKNQKQGVGFEYDKSGKIITLNTYKANVLVKQRKINREDEQKQKQGMWMTFHKNRKVAIEGPYVNNLKNGYWKFYKSDGNLIKVEKWIMGVLQENASEVAKIEIKTTLNPETGTIATRGSYRNGEKEGVHREYDENGNVIGSKIYEKGFVLFEGIIDEQGRKQGPWKEFFRTGELKAEGKYKDDLKIRKWVYYYINGKVEQSGDYLRGKPEGIWKWYFEDGQVLLEEEYVDGLEDGPSVEYSDTSTVIAKGNYIEGLKDGEWFYQVNDYKEIGKYFDGQRTGTWTHYFDTDKVRFKGDYENGLESGFHVYYYDNEQVERRGKYAGGLKEGIWEYFEPDGTRTITIEYSAGVETKYNGEKISYGRRLDREIAKEKASKESE